MKLEPQHTQFDYDRVVLEEKLLITEEMAKMVLNYQNIIDEELRKSEEETEKAREIFLNQFKEYSE